MEHALTPHETSLSGAAGLASDWHASLLFVSGSRRDDIRALLSLSEELHRLNARTHEPAVRQQQLDWWRAEFAQLFGGTPSHPAVKAIQPLVARCGLPNELFTEMLDGLQMEMQVPRFPDFKTLQLYCYRVSGSLHALISEVSTYRERATLKFAHELGIAIRLSEIIENLGHDVRQGRLLLPMEELQTFGVAARELLACEESKNVLRLIEFNLARAETRLRAALALLPSEDRGTQRFGRTLASIHLATLAEIRRDGGRVLSHRLTLTPLRRWWIAARTGWQA